jgi:hypothetical protein
VISLPLTTGGNFGTTHPQVLLCRIASTTRAKPTADSAAPTTSSFGLRAATGAGFIRFRNSRIPMTMTTSPAKTRRHVNVVVTQPPISGPAAIAAAATPPIIAYANARSLPS